jgi:tRNA dimethylallyltransferase
LNSGMIEEVAGLHELGVSWEKLDYFGLEYRYVAMHLKGELSRSELREKLFIKIRQFAKRQDIWFRKMEREGTNIYWIREGEQENASELIKRFLNSEELAPPEMQIKDIDYGSAEYRTRKRR